MNAAIDKSLKEDGHCKSYEGAMRIGARFPDFFDHKEELPQWIIELDCYVVGPSRHYKWWDSSLSGVISKAEKEIRQWIQDDENMRNGNADSIKEWNP